ncbi:MAG: hypothetical protein COB22_05920 [Cycloclasticus sp.]|nr:MAG: hypothetical protein COB22_05920 [Cycloclasticus sp.]
MGVIQHKALTTIQDLHNYLPEFNPDGTEKHIVCDGARFHVLAYSVKSETCSCKNCEVNKHGSYFKARIARIRFET